MIPLSLTLTGFLSYRDQVEIDFTGFDLACIAGPNGAGKSSLLDAITWALFGQARKRDDSLINAQSSMAEVSLTFGYEGNLYRVQRTKPREKTMLLEFHILQRSEESGPVDGSSPQPAMRLTASDESRWKALTERTLRDTEERIRQTLRLDYDTFVNASFFLQGKADQFTQQRPGDRKRILSSILGLEIWETYRQQAAERRKAVEAEIDNLDGRLQEIVAELAEEDARKSRLHELQTGLDSLGQQRANQESIVTNIRQITATLAEQRKLVENLARQLEMAAHRQRELEVRLEERCQERDSYATLQERAAQIDAAYAAWQADRAELERLDEVAGRFREHEKRREQPRTEIQAERARLAQELQTLQNQQSEIEAAQAEIENLRVQIQAVSADLAVAEALLAQRGQLDLNLQAARQRQTEARAENTRLKTDMDELKLRIDRLTETEGAECPLCGQPLSPLERQNLIDSLAVQGKEMGDRYRANQNLLRDSESQVADLEAQFAALSQPEADARMHTQTLAGLSSQLKLLEIRQAQWQESSAPRLNELLLALESETYAAEWRTRLADIDAELMAIGYDAAAHDEARQRELLGRASEADLRALEKARAALAPLEREIADLQVQLAVQQAEVERQQLEHQNAAQDLADRQAQAPDLNTAERTLFDLQEQENRLRLEVGAARQRVLILDDLKTRRKTLEAQRETLADQVRQYKQLERSFSKDGVPALLIEQALPEIEARANDLLDRLSGGNMSVRFVTQAAYKNKNRDDLKETLDIQISDSAGTRDYEMFSGGEAFRVNFAIRLALSEVLARRAGARLQTLVIDEGFGSQDALGRQRLIEAINLVRPDFAKVLVITHIDELKDAFPNRIEVEKSERGSSVRMI